MRINVELLRAICFTEADLETYANVDDFTKKEIEFMVEFKKIYELGLNQLEKFINKLDEEGKDLDEYTIQYYVTLLLNGPLGQYARKLSKDKKYFIQITDIMGMAGNNARTSANTALYQGDCALGCNVDLYNKLPEFMQKGMTDIIKQSEGMFRDNLKSFMEYDNTLPLVDKKPQDRYNQEPTGEWVTKSNGSYMVKDSWYHFNVQKKVNQIVFAKILEYLGEENNRIFKDKKTYNPFSDDNDSTSQNYKLEQVLTEGDKKETVIVDLMGNVFDSVEKRASTIKVSTPTKDKTYQLGTVKGQLGI